MIFVLFRVRGLFLLAFKLNIEVALGKMTLVSML